MASQLCIYPALKKVFHELIYFGFVRSMTGLSLLDVQISCLTVLGKHCFLAGGATLSSELDSIFRHQT